MINLRYHIVSITAVFLALGIGTALGGTFLDRYTVDVLDRNIRSAEQRIRDTEAANNRLEAQIRDANERNEALIETGSVALFEGHLEDQPVLVVASQGVDADVLSNIRTALVRADADLRGTLELRDDLDLQGEIDEALAEAVEQDASDPDAVRAAVHTALRDAFHAAGQPVPEEPEGGADEGGTPGDQGAVPGAGTDPAVTTTTAGFPPVDPAPPAVPPADPTSTTTVPEGGAEEDEGPDGQPEIVSTLLEQDLIRFTPGPGLDENAPILEARGYRYVFVGDPDIEPVATRVMLALLPTPARRAVPAVVVTETPPLVEEGEEAPAPSVVAEIRDNNERAAIYNTVDDVDTFTGLTAMVLVLADLGTAETGHYGQAPGATAVLPGPT